LKLLTRSADLQVRIKMSSLEYAESLITESSDCLYMLILVETA